MSQLSLTEAIAKAYRQGNKVLICGNGGLAAESEHFAAELVGKYGRDVFIPALSLTCPSSLITALANDIGYELIFAHQVSVIGNKGDIFIGLTTSKSGAIMKAAQMAECKGMISFVFHRDNLAGDDVAEKQETVLRILHRAAREAKELIYEDPLYQPEQSESSR